MSAARRHLEHLPPGAQPGAQSERLALNLRAGGFLAAFLVLGGIVFLALLAGAALLLAAGTSDVGGNRGGPDPAWLWLAGLAGAACFFAAALSLWRAAHPRRDRTLAVRLDRHQTRRGDELRALISGAGEHAAVEVTLACAVHWDMRGRTRRSRNPLARTVAHNLVWYHRTRAAPSGEVRLRLPADQPYSHEGHVVSFAWMIDACTVVDGRRGRDCAPAAVWVDP